MEKYETNKEGKTHPFEPGSLNPGTPVPGQQGLKDPACLSDGFTSCRQVPKIQLNNKGQVLYANEDAVNLYRIPQDEFKGLPIWMFIHPDDVNDAKTALLHAFHHEQEKLVFLKHKHVDNYGGLYFISWVNTLKYNKTGALCFVDMTATAILDLSSGTKPV